MTDDIRTKKLMNAPEDIIPEAIEGMLSAHPDLLRVEGATRRALIARDGPRDGKVGIVIGGGSGHEPAFAGYVGRGLADAAAVGNVFASPSPEHIMDAARAVEGGAGVMFLYGNYTGDVMNFDMAAEECDSIGIPARSVAVTDDVASAPKGREGERRGIAGDFFVFKIAGAAAEQGRDLAACHAAAVHANANCRSMGVALSACSLPQTGKPNFELGARDMEIGMGIHGEPGMRRGALETADEVSDELMDAILADMELGQGDEVAVLVNGLGATGLLELYILHRRVTQILGGRGVKIHYSWVGEYCTSLEMAGASITLLKLDADLKTLLDMPCRTPALTVAGTLAPAGTLTKRSHDGTAGAAEVDRSTLAKDGPVTPETFRRMMLAVGEAIHDNRDWLSELDGVIGDGDHGVTMDIGWSAVRKELAAPVDETITQTSTRMAKAFLDAVGASSGPLYASAFRKAGEAVSDRLNLDAGAVVAWVEGICAGIQSRGGAQVGDKTMIDAWVPAVAKAKEALQSGGDVSACLEAACAGARNGRDYTAEIESRRGRSAKLGQRSLGHVDPGAASAHVMLVAMHRALSA
ncbi:MAG: dihydroxyacetone kinase [Rhodobacteraceae bacterium]|jgi:dihydroxyacetone kinase phosphoprotein-dependent L subunit|uniref:Homodimeric dihydroxyacetone kinase n=1 Tax=Salipiger profundus TaxID=1229727 RepID=A0A1U7DCA4_9RHOB|nr:MULTISPECIES: dihydroxyacetone kinase subunit DhaL [Salipiger]APX25807.1 homodimeric dihydroxyacetone kinase [Salipiger profundus]MAB08468.1 dihydroxyacetone kinase [Paracoccaceae bacterium]SFC86029.1 homodimeric dihydroxyacetone kinase [Salipiger profundus]